MKTMLFAALLPILAALPARADRPSIHGMWVVRGERTYLAHLPMYHSPHDFQAVLEVELPAPAHRLLEAAPAGQVFTFVPRPFDLSQIREGQILKGSLFKGHFERDGEELLSEAAARVVKKVIFRSLSRNEPAPAAARYFAFGAASGRAFLTHRVAGAPSFDQILVVSLDGGAPVPADGAELSVRQASPGDLPLPGNGPAELNDGSGGARRIQIRASLFVERDDLAE